LQFQKEEKENQECQSKFAAAVADLRLKDTEALSLAHQIAALQALSSSTQKELSATSTQYGESSRKCAALEHEITRLEGEQHNWAISKEQLDARVVELMRENKTLIADAMSASTDAQDLIDSLKKRISTLEQVRFYLYVFVFVFVYWFVLI
jgi:septal ring factor EnvC (AmiA/AmiB activator)